MREAILLMECYPVGKPKEQHPRRGASLVPLRPLQVGRCHTSGRWRSCPSSAPAGAAPIANRPLQRTAVTCEPRPP